MSRSVQAAAGERTINIQPFLAAIKERGPANKELRRITDESIADLKASGFIRSMVPARWGGLEVTPQEFFSRQIEIAEYDMSTAWVGGIIAIHAFQLALMDEAAQQDVYGADPDTCVASSYNPTGGKTEIADEGVWLSGRWGWSSGCDHCDWVLLGAIIAKEGYRTFLVPRKDFKIEDTWYSMGLQGTGSNDIVIDEPVLIPHYRTHKQMDGFNCMNDQANIMYNLPWAQTFIRVVSSPAIGAAKHALKLFIGNAKSSSTDPTKLMSDPDVLRRVVEAENLVDQAQAIMLRNFDVMMEQVMAGETISLIDRVRYRYQASTVIDDMIKAVDLLFDVAGGRSVFTGAAIQDIWHDIHIARAHVANSPVTFTRNWGNMMFGGENTDFFI